MKLKAGDIVMPVKFDGLDREENNYMTKKHGGYRPKAKEIYEVLHYDADWYPEGAIKISGKNAWWLRADNFVKVGEI